MAKTDQIRYSGLMNRTWRHQDIIDLEFLIDQDRETTPEKLHRRDRQLYLEQIQPQLEGDQPHTPANLMNLWLQARRSQQPPADIPSPGQITEDARKVLQFLLAVLGGGLGLAAGYAFFSYSGTMPVNVLHFLLCFVFSQLLLLALLGIGTIYRALRARPSSPSLLLDLLGRLSIQIVLRLRRQLINRMTAETHQAFTATLGRLRMVWTSHATLFFWPFFIGGQLFGVCFNLGLLLATFTKIAVSDIAFGWQSTLQFGPSALLSAVRWLALPWSWLLPEQIAYPSLAEIEGSRIVLKEGIYHLATTDLVSWWPFLLLAVLVYGLFSRLILLLYGALRQHRSLAILRFDRPSHRQILRRMQTPLVTSQAEAESPPAASPAETQPREEKEPQPPPAIPAVTLVPDEIYDQIPAEILAAILQQHGFELCEQLRFLISYETDSQLLAELAGRRWPEDVALLLLVEAWMPPIVSFLSLLKDLRHALGENRAIYLKLLGKPTPATPLTPVTDDTMETVWQRKLAALADPHLHIAPLIRETPQ